MKIKLEMDGYRALKNPRIEYDSIKIEIGNGEVQFFADGKHVASMISKTHLALGDTLNLMNLHGYLDVDLK